MSNSGWSACVGFGTETTWGTAVARARWLRYLRSELKTEQITVPRYTLPGAGTGVPLGRGVAITREQSGGPLEVVASYNDATAFLLGQWIGTVAEGGGGGPTYTHTYTLVSPEALLVGFTLEQVKNRISTTNYSDVFEGCVVQGGTLTIPESGMASLALDIIAQTSAARTTAGTPTFSSAGDPIMGWHGGNLTHASLNGAVKSIALTVRQNLERRWLTGSLYTARPYPTGMYEVSMRVVREHDEQTTYAAYRAQTQGDAAITYTGPSSTSLAITLQNAIVTDYSDPTTNPGVNDCSFTLTGFSDGTDLGLSVVLTNGNDTYDDN